MCFLHTELGSGKRTDRLTSDVVLGFNSHSTVSNWNAKRCMPTNTEVSEIEHNVKLLKRYVHNTELMLNNSLHLLLFLPCCF